MIKVSPSKIWSYDTCPLQYEWRYEKKLISIKWPALVLWSRYHELVRQYHIDWNEHRNNIWKEYEMLWCYIKNPIKWTIVDTELKINFNVELENDTVEVNIVLDRIDEDKLIDYKSSSFDYKEKDCRNIQSLLYVYWYWITTWEIKPFYFHVVNKIKMSQKKYLPQIMKPVIYTEEELKEVPKIIQDFVNKVEKKEFKATPSTKCWSCDFWPGGIDYCPYARDWMYKK